MPIRTAALLLSVSLAGCTQPPATSDDYDPGPLRQRALDSMARGVLFKPSPQSAETLEHELAPLLIRKLDDEDPVKSVSPVRRVFWLADDVDVEGRRHARWTYYWRDGRETPQGVRMTMDSDGSPAVWEVLDAGAPRRAAYVSGGLEAAAAGVFGDPGMDSFATERSGGDGWIVARRIEAGPMALGPFVYLDEDDRIVSVICRCMPSQVNDIPATAEYELVEAELDAKTPPDWGVAGPADGLRLDGVPF